MGNSEDVVIGSTIRQLRDTRGWNQDELARRLGINRTALSRRESGTIRTKRNEQMNIAEVFELTIEQFDELIARERAKRGLGAVMNHAVVASDRIPVHTFVPAGTWQETWGLYVDNFSEETLPREVAPDLGAKCFAVTVRGHSMDGMPAELRDGDQVLVDPDWGDIEGSPCYVLLKAESKYGAVATIKRVYSQQDGSVRLIPDNTKYKPMHVQAEDIDKCYRVVRKIQQVL